MIKKYIEKAAVLIEALPYIQNFRGSTVVVKFGGSVMEDSSLIESALRDIVFMECIGMKPIIVHGGGKAITAKLKERNIQSNFINGLRYTCDETIEIVDDVLHNNVNKNLVDILNSLGGRAESLSGKDIYTAEKIYTEDKATGKRLELGNVGTVKNVNVDRIKFLTDRDIIPVIPPLALDRSNKVYNINADIAAAITAEFLKARKLVFISDVPGILKNPSNEESVISSIKIEEIEEYISNGIISGGMIPKVKSALSALDAGTNKVHFIDGRVQHSLLLEIFTVSGIGTQIIKENSPFNI